MGALRGEVGGECRGRCGVGGDGGHEGRVGDDADRPRGLPRPFLSGGVGPAAAAVVGPLPRLPVRAAGPRLRTSSLTRSPWETWCCRARAGPGPGAWVCARGDMGDSAAFWAAFATDVVGGGELAASLASLLLKNIMLKR